MGKKRMYLVNAEKFENALLKKGLSFKQVASDCGYACAASIKNVVKRHKISAQMATAIEFRYGISVDDYLLAPPLWTKQTNC